MKGKNPLALGQINFFKGKSSLIKGQSNTSKGQSDFCQGQTNICQGQSPPRPGQDFFYMNKNTPKHTSNPLLTGLMLLDKNKNKNFGKKSKK